VGFEKRKPMVFLSKTYDSQAITYGFWIKNLWFPKEKTIGFRMDNLWFAQQKAMVLYYGNSTKNQIRKMALSGSGQG
jgi:hypothetical protein